jgi:hypothetical protein
VGPALRWTDHAREIVSTELRIALVSTIDHDRGALAAYLARAGFEVHTYDELSIPSAFSALVLISDEMTNELRTRVRMWLRATRIRRVVVVTGKPSALDELRAAHSGRLFVFAPPVFAWDLVDALRTTGPTRPRSA